MTSRLLAILMALMSAFSTASVDLQSPFALGEYLILVNRDYTLDASYEPQDLIKPNVSKDSSAVLMREEAAHALEALFNAAKEEENLRLIATSGYRSYDTQELLYQRKIKTTGSEAKARLLVAPAGASEHQLGLAMDLKAPATEHLNSSFANTKEYKWVEKNAHRFGFIIRYKAEWTDITGYSYEPWHIRYVGVKHAQIIYEMNIPLEEYICALRLISEDEYLKGN